MIRCLTIALVLAGLLLLPTHLPSCGPFFDTAVFTEKSHPLLSDRDIIQGNLGVVHPTFWRKFLFYAYRHFSGEPLTEAELKLPSSPENPDGAKLWLETRQKITGEPSPRWIDATRRTANYLYYSNCTIEAFQTAAATLTDRAARFGPVREWIAAQDTVFKNCAEGRHIPAPPEPGLPPILKADREYQIAAAHFYSESFDEARRRFQTIAADSSSPWRSIAPYLAARTLIRKAALTAGENQYDTRLMEQAAKELKEIGTGSAQRLARYAALRAEPLESLRGISSQLMDPARHADFHQNLTDFQYLMDRYQPGWAVAGELPEWIATFQNSSLQALEHSIQKYNQTRSLPWLVALISKLDAKHPLASEIAKAASAIPKNSPAFLTLAYHRVRLLLESGEKDPARAELDTLLTSPMPASARNLFRAQRLLLARGFDDFLLLSPRTPVGLTTDYESGLRRPDTTVPLFDADSTVAFNHGLPLSMLERAATDSRLPAHLRSRLAAMTWTRAILLDDHTRARSLSPLLKLPAPKDQFSAAWTILHNPGLTPLLVDGYDRRSLMRLSERDMFRENWWCAAVESGESAVPAPFLTTEERAQLEAEHAKLRARPAAPTWLARIAIAWAAAHPNDPRSPEALHLAVRATRYGCTDKNNGEVSRAAFQLLHRRWPASEWAKKTPYWYNSP